MIFLELFRWWYGPGWLLMLRKITDRPQKISRVFAIGTLLGTLFSPWKRIMTTGAKSIDDKMRAFVDNLVSRTVGFVVRSTVLFTAAILLAGSLIAGVLIAIIWPLVPVLILVFLMIGVT